MAEEINALLPHILPFTYPGREALGPVRVLNMFEHRLAQDGIYQLAVADDGTLHLLLQRWHRQHVARVFADLPEALRYCQQHHWYDHADD